MKYLLLSCLALFSVASWGLELECLNQTTPSRQLYTRLSLSPWSLQAHQWERDCPVSGGNLEICFDRGPMVIANDNEICGYRVRQSFDCETVRHTDANGDWLYDTRCRRNGVLARLRLTPNGQGRLTCSRGGRILESWRLGRCY